MKILQVIPTLYPTISFGGGSIVAWELSKSLVQKGNSVTIISTDAGDNGRTPSGRFMQDDVAVIRAKNLSNILAYQFKLFVPLMSPKAIRKETKSCNIVHLHDFRTALNLSAGRMAIDGGLPIVVQPHGTIRGDYSGRRLLKRSVDITMGKRIASKVDAWIALSEIEKSQLVGFGIDQSRIHILPNGIDTSQLQTDVDKATARKALGIDGRKKMLLYIGRIHEIKGIDILIDGLAEVLRQEKDLTLVVAGSDDGALPKLKEKTKSLGLSGHVDFRGIVIGREKNCLLRAADAFILPSRKEAFPISLLEACAAGLPIITTDNSDVSREINGICGYTVKGTPSDLAGAIMKLLSEKDIADRFSSAGKTYASRYSWSVVVTKYIELYKTLVK